MIYVGKCANRMLGDIGYMGFTVVCTLLLAWFSFSKRIPGFCTHCTFSPHFFTPFLQLCNFGFRRFLGSYLVGGWTTQLEKYAQVKFGSFPRSKWIKITSIFVTTSLKTSPVEYDQFTYLWTKQINFNPPPTSSKELEQRSKPLWHPINHYTGWFMTEYLQWLIVIPLTTGW